MSRLQERLRRLGGRGSAGAPDAGIRGTAGGLPDGARGMDAAGGSRDDAGSGLAAAGRSALPSRGRLVETEAGCFIMRERRYPLHHEHGFYALGDLAGRHGRLNRVARRHAGMPPVASHADLLFFDAETTGLGVGAGNVPFMIGLGFYENRAFVVRQLFVRDPGEEAAVLHYFSAFAARFTHLVTYNGKSFDWPVVANRYVLHRMPFDGRLEHLDLLYIARHLWRNSLASCRLSRVEEERLGIRREEDVPGHLAPILYFQYLADGEIGPLEGVFRHNEWDVLTLAALAAHLGAVLAGEAEWDKMEAEELYRAGLWLQQSGLPDLAERPFGALLARPEEADRYAARLAAAYKKMRRYDKAVPLWERAAGHVRAGSRLAVTAQSLEPFVELAIYYEHHGRRPAEALRWTEEALDMVERLSFLHARQAAFGGGMAKVREWKAALAHRRCRLLGKLRKDAAAGSGPRAAESEAGRGLCSPAAGTGLAARRAGPRSGAAGAPPEAAPQQLRLDWGSS